MDVKGIVNIAVYILFLSGCHGQQKEAEVTMEITRESWETFDLQCTFIDRKKTARQMEVKMNGLPIYSRNGGAGKILSSVVRGHDELSNQSTAEWEKLVLTIPLTAQPCEMQYSLSCHLYRYQNNLPSAAHLPTARSFSAPVLYVNEIQISKETEIKFSPMQTNVTCLVDKSCSKLQTLEIQYPNDVYGTYAKPNVSKQFKTTLEKHLVFKEPGIHKVSCLASDGSKEKETVIFISVSEAKETTYKFSEPVLFVNGTQIANGKIQNYTLSSVPTTVACVLKNSDSIKAILDIQHPASVFESNMKLNDNNYTTTLEKQLLFREAGSHNISCLASDGTTEKQAIIFIYILEPKEPTIFPTKSVVPNMMHFAMIGMIIMIVLLAIILVIICFIITKRKMLDSKHKSNRHRAKSNNETVDNNVDEAFLKPDDSADNVDEAFVKPDDSADNADEAFLKSAQPADTTQIPIPVIESETPTSDPLLC